MLSPMKSAFCPFFIEKAILFPLFNFRQGFSAGESGCPGIIPRRHFLEAAIF